MRNELRDTQFDKVTWGKGVKATDWNQAAEEAAERVAAANPDMLIIVEGIGFAGHLENVAGHPIKVPKKVDFLSNLCPPQTDLFCIRKDWCILVIPTIIGLQRATVMSISAPNSTRQRRLSGRLGRITVPRFCSVKREPKKIMETGGTS